MKTIFTKSMFACLVVLLVMLCAACKPSTPSSVSESASISSSALSSSSSDNSSETVSGSESEVSVSSSDSTSSTSSSSSSSSNKPVIEYVENSLNDWSAVKYIDVVMGQYAKIVKQTVYDLSGKGHVCNITVMDPFNRIISIKNDRILADISGIYKVIYKVEFNGLITSKISEIVVKAQSSSNNEFQVNYDVMNSIGGYIKGDMSQTVKAGGDATSVTALPRIVSKPSTSNPNYKFVSWSDGVKTAMRTDTNIRSNKYIMANFEIDTSDGGGSTVSSDTEFENENNWITGVGANISTSREVKSVGDTSLKFERTDNGGNWTAIEFNKPLNITGGKKYKLSFSVLATNSANDALFLRLDNRGVSDTEYANDSVFYYEGIGTDQWKQYSKEFIANENDNSYKLRIIFDRAQVVYFDNIKIEEVIVDPTQIVDSPYDDPANWVTGIGADISTSWNIKQDGNTSLKFARTDNGGNWVAIEYKNPLNIIGGKKYKLTFSALATNSTNAALFLRLDNRGMSDAEYATDSISYYEGIGTDQWKQYSKEFIANSNDNSYKLRIICDRAQVIYIDNIKIEEVIVDPTTIIDSPFDDPANWVTGIGADISTSWNIKQDGNTSLKFSRIIPGGQWVAIEYRNPLNLIGGKKYKLTFSVLATNSANDALFLRLDNRGMSDAEYATDSVSYYEGIGTDQWKQYSKEFIANSNDNSYKLRIICDRAQVIYIDNIKIEEVIVNPTTIIDSPFDDPANWVTAIGANISTSWDIKKYGNTSLKFKNENTIGDWIGIEYKNPLNIVSGKTYRFSFSLLATNKLSDAIFLRLDYRNLGDLAWSGDTYSIYDNIGTDQWKNYSTDFVAKTNDNSYKLRIIGDRLQTIYIDNISIEEIQPADIKVPDSHFEDTANWVGHDANKFTNNYDILNVKTGKSSIKLYQEDGVWRYYKYSFTNLIPGQQYVLTFSEKVIKVGSWIYFNNKQDNITAGNLNKIGNLDINGWQKYSYSFTYSAGDFLTIMGYYNFQEVYYDDLVIEPFSAANLLLSWNI